MTNETHGRGQAEWALWRAFARQNARGSGVPAVFRTRIKRLLDIDRDLDLSCEEVLPECDYAFVAPPDREGAEARFTVFDVFCLAVALDFLDAGFKQSEVVFLIRYVRPEIQRRFSTMLARPFIDDRKKPPLAEYHPSLPSYEWRDRSETDSRIFMVLKKVELREIRPALAAKDSRHSMVLQPVFCEGTNALAAELYDATPRRYRIATVVELTSTAQLVQARLEQAPEIRRGRTRR